MNLSFLSVFILSGTLAFAAQAHTDKTDEFHGAVCGKDKESAECKQAKKWIRRNHMDVLVHERDRTARLGIRFQNLEKKPIHGSLRACVSCHVKKDKKTGEYPLISSKKHHCAGCHMKAAVKPDCFECHSTRPDQVTLKRLGLDKEE